MGLKRFSAWGDLAGLAAVFLAATLIAGLCVGVSAGLAARPERGMTMFIVYTVQFTLAVIGGILWLRSRAGVRLRLGIDWSDGPLILGGMVLVTAAGIVIEPLLMLFPESQFEKLSEAIGRGGWTILTTVAAAPLLEEIFFRGLVLETLSRRWSSRWAVSASAVLFALAHAPLWPQMINALVIAIVMGYIYLLSRSLIPVIAIHAINNGLAYMALELTGSQMTDTRALIGDDTLYRMVRVVSAVILVVAIVAIGRGRRTKNHKFPLNKKTADE